MSSWATYMKKSNKYQQHTGHHKQSGPRKPEWTPDVLAKFYKEVLAGATNQELIKHFKKPSGAGVYSDNAINAKRLQLAQKLDKHFNDPLMHDDIQAATRVRTEIFLDTSEAYVRGAFVALADHTPMDYPFTDPDPLDEDITQPEQTPWKTHNEENTIEDMDETEIIATLNINKPTAKPQDQIANVVIPLPEDARRASEGHIIHIMLTLIQKIDELNKNIDKINKTQ